MGLEKMTLAFGEYDKRKGLSCGIRRKTRGGRKEEDRNKENLLGSDLVKMTKRMMPREE